MKAVSHLHGSDFAVNEASNMENPRVDTSGSKHARIRSVTFNDTVVNIDDGSREIDGNDELKETGGIDKVPNGMVRNVVNTDGQEAEENQIIEPDVSSYANTLQNGTPKADKPCSKINFRFLESVDKHNGADVVLPRETVKIVQDKLAFTLYGYFLGDRLAYPVVENFVRSNWRKYGIQKIMMNANGFFFFKFADTKGMLGVLEGGSWLIRNKPVFLNIWNPNSSLKKEDIKKVAIWVKLHDVPIVAYTDDGLSMLASKLGSPKLLDSYTTTMCADNWGRSSYARALIEISAEHEFKEVISVAIPDLDGGNYSTEIVHVEYEWKPPRCAHCCVFGHGMEACPKQTCTTPDPHPNLYEDGFTEVRGRNLAKKKVFQIKNQKPKFDYRPVDYKKMVGARPSTSGVKSRISSKIQIQNSFNVLNSENVEEGGNLGSSKRKGISDGGTSEVLVEEEVECIYDKTVDIKSDKSGASSFSAKVSNG